MYKEELVINNLQRLICHKTKPNQLTPCELVVNILVSRHNVDILGSIHRNTPHRIIMEFFESDF